MSTKIYNAWRSRRKVASVRALRRLSDAIRHQLEPAARRLFFRTAGEFVVREADTLASLNQPVTGMVEKLTARWMESVKRHRDGERDPGWDVHAEWALLPDRDGHVYLMMFAENSLIQEFKWARDWEDYHFQNSTDRPAHISARDWEERKRTWRRLLQGRTPSEVGFVVRLWGEHGGPVPAVADLLRYQPSHATRVKRLARQTIANRKFGELGVKTSDSSYSMLVAVRDYMQSDAGKAAVRVEEERLRSLLPRRITRALLGGSP